MNTTTRENLGNALHASDKHTIDDIVAYQVRRTVDSLGVFMIGCDERETVIGVFKPHCYADARKLARSVEESRLGYAVVDAIFADGCHAVI